MTDRILEISERPARLSVSNSLLVVRFGEEEPLTIPLTDLAVVIASHPHTTYTQAVLSGLAAAGAMFVACDQKFQAAAMLLPLRTHSLQTERFAAQALLPLPRRKRLWQQLVRAKILAQARVLGERYGQDFGLKGLAGRVGSGDPQNCEAQAARIYWKRLFAEVEFRRDTDGDGWNALLNYGYAVLRAVTARAACAAGLHPSLGVHHHNRYNPFCLADDLMEPFRPLVDRLVASIPPEQAELNRETKRLLLEGLAARFSFDGESRTLFDWVARTAFSLAAVIAGEKEKLEIASL